MLPLGSITTEVKTGDRVVAQPASASIDGSKNNLDEDVQKFLKSGLIVEKMTAATNIINFFGGTPKPDITELRSFSSPNGFTLFHMLPLAMGGGEDVKTDLFNL